MGAANVILYARWTVNSYTVTANAGANGTITPATRTVSHGGTTTFTVTPSAGYTAAVTGCGGTLSGNTYTTGVITTDCTVNTTFSLNSATSYTVTYNTNGASSGSIPADQTKIHDVALTLATNAGNLAKTGYDFAGWNTTIDGTGTSYAAGASYTANVNVILYAKWTPVADTTAPTITAFTLPATSTSLTVAITTFTTSETIGVSYLLTESSTTPAANATGWSTTKPTSHTFGTAGSKTLYAWVKDQAQNISISTSGTVLVDTTAPVTPTTIIPIQTNITVSTTAQGTTYIATGNSMIINVACAAGERANVYQS